MSPSQYNAWLRQRAEAVRRYNAEVDRRNRAQQQAIDKHNREVARHNQTIVDGVRRYNQAVDTENQRRRQQLQQAINKYNQQVRTVRTTQPIVRRSLADVSTLYREIPPGTDRRDSEQAYDVFISHASEDKEEIVRALATALQSCGLRVWYDEFALKIGDSLRQKIDRGLANSRVGIVVLSEAFFGKGWTNYELDGIVSRAISGEQQLLPIWHKVSKADVMKYSPSLVDKVARSTLQYTPEEIAVEIAELILGKIQD